MSLGFYLPLLEHALGADCGAAGLRGADFFTFLAAGTRRSLIIAMPMHGKRL